MVPTGPYVEIDIFTTIINYKTLPHAIKLKAWTVGLSQDNIIPVSPFELNQRKAYRMVC